MVATFRRACGCVDHWRAGDRVGSKPDRPARDEIAYDFRCGDQLCAVAIDFTP
jgi:hypothetical protein